MKRYDINEFNQVMRGRTRNFAISVFRISSMIKLNELSRIPVKQLIRSASSVAANYYSATRGRSEAEYYSKLCIVVEENDEVMFWLDFLMEVGVLNTPQARDLLAEADELLRIFSSIKKKLKLKRTPLN
ncbi:MAG: four helix bundle protein [Bacteroidales bacterium]|jgi:four helix bundle protein|nr:four helix bundle protein [Bacteroidales bacterium]